MTQLPDLSVMKVVVPLPFRLQSWDCISLAKSPLKFMYEVAQEVEEQS